MQIKKSTWLNSAWAILYKDLLCEFRTRYALGTLTMFTLVTLSGISMTLAGAAISSSIAAMLLWIILFFCAMAGLARTFVYEQEAGTLFTLRLYANGQAVLAGKLLFNILLLQLVTALLIPLFLIFLNIEVHLWGQLVYVLFFGTVGVAAVATLTAFMVSCTNAKGSLFTVITFPLLLPQFLTAIAATGQILADTIPGWNECFFLAGYDATVIAAASLLFDYLWYD
ncbi:MAG: heme exporter protein CcmB [Veillonellales bacterium]